MAIVILPSHWYGIVGQTRSLDVPADTVGELITMLKQRYPDLKSWMDNGMGSLPEFMNVYVGEDDIRVLEDLFTPLTAADEVRFIPVMSGGALF